MAVASWPSQRGTRWLPTGRAVVPGMWPVCGRQVAATGRWRRRAGGGDGQVAADGRWRRMAGGGGWPVAADGRWRMAGGGCPVADGRWRMGGGGWAVAAGM